MTKKERFKFAAERAMRIYIWKHAIVTRMPAQLLVTNLDFKNVWEGR